MAEGIMKKMIKDYNLKDITCESAGTYPLMGEHPSKYAIKVCKTQGVDISAHTAREISPDLLSRADVVFVMTLQQKIEILKKGVPTGKIYVPSYGIPDPYGGSYRKYKATLNLIIDGLKSFISEL